MADERLVAQAVEILRGRFTSQAQVEDASAFLEGFAPFDAMETDEIDEIAETAISRLPARTSLPSGHRSRGHPVSHPPNRRQPPAGVTPAAPFRFVVLPEEVVLADPASLDQPVAGGLCATIAVQWAAETPLLIGASEQDGDAVVPLRLGSAGADHVIPGASLRGMIRAAVEIVAHARLGSANLHHRYGLRDFDHPAYAERSPVSRVGEVKAGWLERTAEGDWQITPCGVDGRDWAHVPIEALLKAHYGRWDRQSPQQWVQRSLAEKYDAVAMKQTNIYDFRKTFGFSAAPDDNGRKIVNPTGARQGTLVFSGKLPPGGRKRFEYVFFAPAGAPVTLKPEIVETFERLYSRPSKNNPVPDGSWRELKPTLESGKRLPVFFVGDLGRQDERFFFGLTRLFKVPHERKVGAVLGEQPNHVPPPVARGEEAPSYAADFVENLFGYVVEPARPDDVQNNARTAPEAVALKGRVAFSFAHLPPGQEVGISEPVSTIMMAPRASFAPFYLKSAAEKDYSADTAPRLAGRKRYLPRRGEGSMADALNMIRQMGQEQLERVRQSSRSDRVSQEVQTQLRFLLPSGAEELRFHSEIRLHNVTAAELGAVLFALTHGGDPAKPYRHMVGRAKPFGAGQLRVVSARLAVEPNDKAASAFVKPPDADEIASGDGRCGFCPSSATGEEAAAANASHRPFLDEFVKRMRKTRGLERFPDVPAVREFLGACNPQETAQREAALGYLPLQAFNEIRKAVKPLRQRERSAPPAPAVFPCERDGRMLASPIDRRRFWRWGPGGT